METKVNGLDVDVFIDQILQLLVPRVIEGLALLTGEELTEEQRRIFGQQFEEMLRAALVGELGSDGLTIEGLYSVEGDVLTISDEGVPLEWRRVSVQSAVESVTWGQGEVRMAVSGNAKPPPAAGNGDHPNRDRNRQRTMWATQTAPPVASVVSRHHSTRSFRSHSVAPASALPLSPDL